MTPIKKGKQTSRRNNITITELSFNDLREVKKGTFSRVGGLAMLKLLKMSLFRRTSRYNTLVDLYRNKVSQPSLCFIGGKEENAPCI